MATKPDAPKSPEMVKVELTTDQAELLASVVEAAFNEADNDSDAAELSDLHELLGYAPLIDEPDDELGRADEAE